jgi:hypothetical protein
VDHLSSVLDHLVSRIFNIPTWTAVAGRVSYQFQRSIPIDAESPFLFPQGSDALPSSAAPIAVTDDDADLFRVAHSISFFLNSRPAEL